MIQNRLEMQVCLDTQMDNGSRLFPFLAPHPLEPLPEAGPHVFYGFGTSQENGRSIVTGVSEECEGDRISGGQAFRNEDSERRYEAGNRRAGPIPTVEAVSRIANRKWAGSRAARPFDRRCRLAALRPATAIAAGW